MPGIFISYRREDSAGHAGRIRDFLAGAFGENCVFMDVNNIDPGQVFPDVIQMRAAACAVAVVVIGRGWLEILRSRAAEGGDFVLAEIQAAVKSGAVVIPVLVQGASMPRIADLPEPLSELGYREAIAIHDASFRHDAEGLVNAIKDVPGLKPGAPVELTGTWIARMDSRGHAWRMCLQFEMFGDHLYGTVEYPTGDGAIQDARLDGKRFSFRTTHVPRFETKPATIQIEGEIVGEEIRLIVANDNGVSRGVATKKPDAG